MLLEEIKRRFEQERLLYETDGKWLIAEIKRLRGLQDKWGEEFARADRHRFVAEQRAEKAKAELAELKTWYKKGIEVANGFLTKPSESHIVDKICAIGWERDELTAENQRLTERVRELEKEVENAYRKGWDDGVELAEQERRSYSKLHPVHQDNGWYKYSSQALQHKEGE